MLPVQVGVTKMMPVTRLQLMIMRDSDQNDENVLLMGEVVTYLKCSLGTLRIRRCPCYCSQTATKTMMHC